MATDGRKWSITLEYIRGTWSVLVMLGREVRGCATADDLPMALSMAGELFEGCLEWPIDGQGQTLVGLSMRELMELPRIKKSLRGEVVSD